MAINGNVSFERLLNEMVCPAALSRMEPPSYVAKSATSYDRASRVNNPMDGLYVETEGRDWGKGWFANHDFGFCIREEIHNGRTERVLQEDHGPGVLVRWWITSMDQGTIRVHLDGSDKPMIEMAPNDLVGGNGLASYPYSFLASDERTRLEWRGRNLYLPIPYEKGCKVTIEGSPKYLYYQINYRSYTPGTKVESFAPYLLDRERSTIESVAKLLTREDFCADGTRVVEESTILASGESVVLKADGSRAIIRIVVRLKSIDYQQALRSTVVRMKFDGEDTVWIPIGALCGVGYSAEKNNTFFTRADPNSRTLECFCHMPFERSARLSLTNYGKDNVTVELFEAIVEEYRWDEHSLYFHATWFEQRNISTARRRDMNFVTISGAGRYVGTSITVFNTDPRPEGETWWGEGDDKVYVDGETFPSIFGTGSEDYFNYAWCRPQRFYNPFGSQPRGEGNKKSGYSNNNRHHMLDDIPFNTSLRFDMELWHPHRANMNYAAATFFYATPGSTTNRRPAPVASGHRVALHRDDVLSVTGETHQNPVQVCIVIGHDHADIDVDGALKDLGVLPDASLDQHGILIWCADDGSTTANREWRLLPIGSSGACDRKTSISSYLASNTSGRHIAIVKCPGGIEGLVRGQNAEKHYRRLIKTTCDSLISFENEHINWEIAGCFLIPGESDAIFSSTGAEEYDTRLQALITELRTDFSSPALPVVIHEYQRHGLRKHDSPENIEAPYRKSVKDEDMAEVYESTHRNDLIFTAPRERPWRQVDDHEGIARIDNPEFQGTARPGEFFVLQMIIVPAENVAALRIEFSNLNGDGGLIPADALRCISLGGTGHDGKPFCKKLATPAGKAQVLWCGLDVPIETKGIYTGVATVFDGDVQLGSVSLSLEVTGENLTDHGESRAASLSRLRWLDSTIGAESTVTAPFQPVETQERTVKVLGRELILGENGLPEQINSFFNSANTHLVESARHVLSSPFSFRLETKTGSFPLEAAFGTLECEPLEARWSATLTGSGVSGSVDGTLDYTGSGSLCIEIYSERDIELGDIRLEIPWREDAAKYFMGLNRQGRRRKDETVDWHWDTSRRQDCFWMGDVNVGLMARFKGANYRRPAVNIYYPFHPLVMPESWGNEGKGGIRVESARNGHVNVTAYSGPRLLRAGEKLSFILEFYLTPFRALDTEKQWTVRFDHPHPQRDFEFLRNKVEEKRPAWGANVLNIHQAHAAAPYINYPYADDSFSELASLVKEGHKKGLKVRIYYTTREVTQNMPELHALHSMNGEIILPGPGADVRTIIHKEGPHPWLVENLGCEFVPAWVDHLGLPNAEWDLSVLTTPDSRWNNFYLEGLRWMIEQTDIDGIYVDDTALDARSLQRARRLLDCKPGRLIDFHTWNHFNVHAGFASNLLLYMELLPYFDRLWIGEGFHCNRADIDFWLVEMSGLPFGLMSEMLQDVNPWRGLVFGEVARLNWPGDPSEIWRVWDEYGIHGTDFIPFFVDDCPVKTGRADIVATVYTREARTFVAIGSWADETCEVILDIDWEAVGLSPDKTSIYVPRILGFQSEAVCTPDMALHIAPGRGYFLVLDEVARSVDHTDVEESLIESFSDPFGAPVLDDGWVVKTSEQGDARAYGGAVQVTTPTNTHAGIERVLPPETVAAELEIRPGTDTSRSHGPGLALVWDDGIAKLSLFPVEQVFKIHVDGKSCAVPGKIGTRVSVRIALADDVVRFQSRPSSEVDWEPLVEMSKGGLVGYPTHVRIGKLSPDGKRIDSDGGSDEKCVSTYHFPITFTAIRT